MNETDTYQTSIEIGNAGTLSPLGRVFTPTPPSRPVSGVSTLRGAANALTPAGQCARPSTSGQHAGRLPLSDRFWSRVEPSDGCWIWAGTYDDKGYGRISWRGGRRLLAHRVSWELHNGPIPNGLCVCHRCDTPACVNPAHLFVGTQADNVRDCVAKRRHAFGERKASAKLTADQVRELRSCWNAGESQNSLALRFGLSKSTVHAIVHREHWGYVNDVA